MNKTTIIMLGTGSPRPDPKRMGSSQLLLIDDLPILIDCGEGTTSQLMKAGIPPHTVKHLWLTHLHSDHTLGYGQFLLGGWANGRRELTLVGPPGTRQFHERILEMYEDDITYRTSLGRAPAGILDVKIIEVKRPGKVDCDISAKVTAESMIHNVPTFAYRFDTASKSIVFSGDTAPTPKLIDLSRDADVLVQDASLAVNHTYNNATNPETIKIWEHLQKEHCTPAQAGDIAEQARVKTLVLTHFLPNVDEEQAYREASNRFSGTVIVSQDLQVITIE